jgi:hypothetical protein
MQLCTPLRPHQKENVVRGLIVYTAIPAGELFCEMLFTVPHNGHGRDSFDVTAPRSILNQLPLPRPQERPPHAAGDDEEALVALTVHIYHRCTVWPFNVCLQKSLAVGASKACTCRWAMQQKTISSFVDTGQG